MRIERLAVRDFRKLDRGVEIAGFDPAITIIVGDNEEGKSTLLKALQAVFFDRHGLTGKAIEDMLPFGAKGVRPAIDVDFVLAGALYRLEKAFGRDPSVSLEGGGGRWQGEDAEDRLRELLGFTQPGRGPAKEEHRGLAGLLWVEQGRAFARLEMNSDSQTALREAIEGEVGQVLGGDRGRRLLAAVKERVGDYYTPTGREKKTLSDRRKRVGELENERQTQERELRDYDKKVKELGDLRRRLIRYDRKDSLTTAKTAMDEADKAVRELEKVDARVETAKASMGGAEAVARAAEKDRDRRAGLAAKASRAEEEAREAATALENLEPERDGAERALTETLRQFDKSGRRRDEAKDAAVSARRARERAKTADELETIENKLKRADALNEKIGREKRASAANPVDDDVLDRLRDLSSKIAGAEAALEAAAVALTFEPEGAMAVSLDGEPVDTDRPVRVTERKTFRLQGFGAVEVRPGDEDIVPLRDRLSGLSRRLRDKLRELGLNDLAAAQTALRERQRSAGRLERLRGELKGIAPEGVEALRETVRGKRESLAAVEGGDGGSPDIESARTVEAEAEGRLEDAESAFAAALRERDAARSAHGKLQDEWIGAAERRRLKAEAADRLQTELAQARRDTADDVLAERAEADRRKFDERKAEYERMLKERDALAPDEVQLEHGRARDAYDRLKKEKNKAERDERDLTIELRTLGQRGLAEELERARGELDIACAELAREEAEAKAWKLLMDTLREAEREAKETFLGPVRDRLKPYLRMLFPDTELRLREDTLDIVSLVRGGVEEPFDDLSVGAREQVAVLTRLAFADLLREKDRPVALILDDPLVNSDDERFDRMQLALRKAAETLQIVVLTCHEARYETLGAKTVRLADCRTGG